MKSTSKKREAGKLNKICLTLGEKNQDTFDCQENKNELQKYNRTIENWENSPKSEALFRAQYKNFHGKGSKYCKSENCQKYTAINTILYNCLNARLLESM